MSILIFVTLSSFIAIACMVGHKIWHVHTGKLEEPDELHIIGPAVHIAQDAVKRLYQNLYARMYPIAQKLYKDLLVILYAVSRETAKRSATFANQVKGKHEVRAVRDGDSFLSGYLKKRDSLS